MSRPVDADGAATKKRIEHAARAEVANVGLGRVTLKAIARRAGVSIGLLSHYYGTKENLIAACSLAWKETLFEWYQHILNIAAEKSEPAEVVYAAADLTMQLAREHRTEMQMLIRQVGATGNVPKAVSDVTFPISQEAAKFAAARCGTTVARARAGLHQSAILISRLAICGDEELCEIYGGDEATAWERCRHEAATSVASFLTLRPDESGA